LSVLTTFQVFVNDITNEVTSTYFVVHMAHGIPLWVRW
jgi:hypothetical protein